MKKDIVLIPGALATPKLWGELESYFPDNVRCQHLDVLNSQSITEMAERFARIAPEKFTLVGFSMGGYVALELFNHIPEKIEKLVLINSSANTVSPKGQAERERSLELIERGKFELLTSLIFKNSINCKDKHPTLLPIAQDMAKEIGAENYRYQLNAILNKSSHVSILTKISCPTLIIVSENDRVMPIKESQTLADQIKLAELIALENCGHLAPLEQPKLLNKIISDWI